MVGPGTCYAVMRFAYSREHFNGLPQCRFEMMGIPVYDPRADSSVGGSGPQRWSDRSTWTQSANLAVLIYNVMRGIDVGAGLRWGGECDAEDLPLDNWFAGMNACDLAIDDGDGGTVAQYRGGIEVAFDDEPASIIEELLTAARDSETAAGNSASAASGSANTATTRATEAGLSATAAAASATSAGTQAGNAATSASQAATSATGAAGSASQAASSASTSATVLSDAQRALASSTAIITGIASSATLPFGVVPGGAVDTYPVLAAGNYASDADGSYLARSMDAANAGAILRAVAPSADDRVYRVTARVKVTSANDVQLVAYWRTAGDVSINSGAWATTSLAAGVVTTIRMVIGRQAGGVVDTVAGGGTTWSAADWIRFGVRSVNAAAGQTFQVYSLQVDDLTQADLAARSANGAAGSATAAATSASSAAASQTAAGTSAAAASSAQTAAETARGQAQTHATNAATSATNAAGSANAAAISQGAAAASQTAAGGSATAAAGSASLATTRASEAGTYSTQALDYRNTAARLMSGGVSRNPVFNDWPGTYPAGVSVTSVAAGTVAKLTSGVRYINALEIDATDPGLNGPLVYLDKTANGLDCSASPKGVLARVEIEYVSGDLAASGALLRGLWQDTAARADNRLVKDLITATPGVVQTIEIYLERPAGAVPGSATNFRLDFYGHTTTLGGTRAAVKFRLHRFDFEEVLASSTTDIYQRTVTEFQGIQNAVIGLRAVAGSSGALL